VWIAEITHVAWTIGLLFVVAAIGCFVGARNAPEATNMYIQSAMRSSTAAVARRLTPALQGRALASILNGDPHAPVVAISDPNVIRFAIDGNDVGLGPYDDGNGRWSEHLGAV
jgi:hypothetical protein